MTQDEFESGMAWAEDLIRDDPLGDLAAYLRGLRYGLRRGWYGPTYELDDRDSSFEGYALRLSLANDGNPDTPLGRGYRDGLRLGREGHDEA